MLFLQFVLLFIIVFVLLLFKTNLLHPISLENKVVSVWHGLLPPLVLWHHPPLLFPVTPFQLLGHFLFVCLVFGTFWAFSHLNRIWYFFCLKCFAPKYLHSWILPIWILYNAEFLTKRMFLFYSMILVSSRKIRLEWLNFWKNTWNFA